VEIFGSGGGDAVAARLTELSGKEVQLMGKIPISQDLRISADNQSPIVVSDPADPAAIEITRIAKLLMATPRGLAGKSLKISTS
jgi:ATP-binding protein involved in chromosome partitioning